MFGTLPPREQGYSLIPLGIHMFSSVGTESLLPSPSAGNAPSPNFGHTPIGDMTNPRYPANVFFPSW